MSARGTIQEAFGINGLEVDGKVPFITFNGN